MVNIKLHTYFISSILSMIFLKICCQGRLGEFHRAMAPTRIFRSCCKRWPSSPGQQYRLCQGGKMHIIDLFSLKKNNYKSMNESLTFDNRGRVASGASSWIRRFLLYFEGNSLLIVANEFWIKRILRWTWTQWKNLKTLKENGMFNCFVQSQGSITFATKELSINLVVTVSDFVIY